jgi:hypothetical protein
LPTSWRNIWDGNHPIELSVYHDELTNGETIKTINRLRIAFPELDQRYFDILMERVIDTHFTDKRLVDAANYVIDNCQYPRPSIAEMISFDKKFRVYRYDELIKLIAETGVKMENYRAVRLHPDQQKPVWVHIDDGKWLPSFIKNDIDH